MRYNRIIHIKKPNQPITIIRIDNEDEVYMYCNNDKYTHEEKIFLN